MKTISTLALVAAAGFLATSAQAADLGGNCCADLEERVAELEATTARKGNRKVSLTVSGHVNENILFFDDGSERNVYAGQTNMAAQSRFRFVGTAKITEDLSAGYLLEIGVASSRSDSVDQNTDDANGALAIRHSAWWLGSKHLGKVWVGQTSTATDGITEVNLANVAHMGMQNLAGNGGGLFVRRADGTLSDLRRYTFMGGANVTGSTGVDSSQIGEGNRQNVVKYESPTLMGFSLAAAFGEDDMWDIATRYAGEHHGFKLAFGVGYQQWTDGNNDERNCAIANNMNKGGNGSDRKCQQLGLSGSVMHVATGLYAHGAYGMRWDDNVNKGLGLDNTTSRYYLQAGIEQKFIALGKTTLFGEYARYFVGANGNSNLAQAATTIGSANTEMWGLGLNQAIDAAAMDLYVNYQHYAFDGTFTNGTTLGNIKDQQQVVVGGIIRF